ncbi:MAG: GNAT family N-acetyltransferase [Calditrichaeota bacterium]|nr:GNAT family N-acetyltransferase [Calditrichota bacterium]
MSTPNFRIREGNPSDFPEIFRLVQELAEYERLRHEVVATLDDYQKFGTGAAPYFHTLLAEVPDKDGFRAVGFALYFFTFSTFLGKPTLYLEDLFVEPPHRGQGIGKALLTELARIALQKDCGRMEWAVLNWNAPAIAFYQSLGAVPQSEWTVYRLTRENIQRLAETSTHSGHRSR